MFMVDNFEAIKKGKKIVGISCYYHDSAAALIIDGAVVSAAQEERFTRKKHDASFPKNALQFVLQSSGLSLSDVDYVVFYDKPLVKFDRLVQTYIAHAPQGIGSFIKAMPVWFKEKLFLRRTLKKELIAAFELKNKDLPELLFTEHHQAHASSAFFPSPYEKSAILCIDGVGEWATTTVWLGIENKIEPCWQINFPHSLGLLYSAFTAYAGFRVNSGEYKLMGLSPYGEPKYVDLIYQHLIDAKDDGSFRLNMKYFDFATGSSMTNKAFEDLFGGRARVSESDITQREMDLACSIQVVTEDLVLRMCRTIKERLNVNYLCLAGGVALNCVANGKLKEEKIYDGIWIQPAPGDAGGAIGAALSIWYEYLGNERKPDGKTDSISGAYLGPAFTEQQVVDSLEAAGAVFEKLNENQLMPEVAGLLAQGNVVGWFQGAMEFGPRALGSRSILGDPRNGEMQTTMNLKIKYRESFRPFAPSVKAESVADWFDFDEASPYMLMVAKVKQNRRIMLSEEQAKLRGMDKLKVIRSQLPAITHVDYSARLQTVHKETNPKYWQLLDQFEIITGCPVLINTSFNVRGEPIVCTPTDAYRCFMRTEMDYLVIENLLLSKVDQIKKEDDKQWEVEFSLD